MSDELLTTVEAAKRLRLGQATLNRWRLSGTGPGFVRLGRKIFYRASDLDRWINGQSRQQPQPDPTVELPE